MMKKSALTIAITLAASLFSSSVIAAVPVEVDGGTVNFNGNLVAAACTIAAGTKDQTVSLGVWDQEALLATKSGNSYGPKIPFSVTLSECNSSVATHANVIFTHEGIYSGIWSSLSNIATVNKANALNLEISDQSGPLHIDGVETARTEQSVTNGTIVFDYNAQYNSIYPSSEITAGNTLYAMTYKVKFY